MTNNTPESFDAQARLTAYALGELSPQETAALEQELRTNDALRAEVDAIAATAQALTAALAAEPSQGLTDDQRHRVTSGEYEGPLVIGRIVTLRRAWAALGLAAAACIVIAVWLPLRSASLNETAVSMSEPAGAPLGAQRREGNEMAQRSGSQRDTAAIVGGDAVAAPPGSVSASVTPAPATMTPSEMKRVAGAYSIDASTDEAEKDFAEARPAPVARADERAGLGETAPSDQSSAEAELGDEFAPTDRLVRSATGGFAGGGAGAGGSGPGTGAPGRRAPASGARMAPGATRLDSSLSWQRGGELRRQVEPDKDALRDRAGKLGLAGEAYAALVDNPFVRAGEEPLSTFSIDVDTASYSNVRRMLADGQLPPPDAVRIEEMINYFTYDYPQPTGEHPFSVSVAADACPWNVEHRLVRIGLKGREVAADMRPATNLVFLIDVSGSMNDREKLPLLKASLRLLVENLTADDRVAMVVYAGAAGVVLDSTYCDRREEILAALERLNAGGSTNGGEGIELAYAIAQKHFIDGGVNRVILCTDGDFNVGIQGDSLDRLIEDKRATGVFLSVLGFGKGNLQDQRMEALSNKGNGNFAYVDSLDEGRRVLVERMAGTLVTIAKDVKIQVDFNPAQVNAYRLIGYANRMLAKEDFRDDRKDAGEIGAGHTVTALYEIVPAGVFIDLPEVEPSKYVQAGEADAAPQPANEPSAANKNTAAPDTTKEAIARELLTVRLRYKLPDAEQSTELRQSLTDEDHDGHDSHDSHDSHDRSNVAIDADLRFAAAVAEFGMLLRDSKYKGGANYAAILDLATPAIGPDEKGERREFVKMVERARSLAEQR